MSKSGLREVLRVPRTRASGATAHPARSRGPTNQNSASPYTIQERWGSIPSLSRHGFNFKFRGDIIPVYPPVIMQNIRAHMWMVAITLIVARNHQENPTISSFRWRQCSYFWSLSSVPSLPLTRNIICLSACSYSAGI